LFENPEIDFEDPACAAFSALTDSDCHMLVHHIPIIEITHYFLTMMPLLDFVQINLPGLSEH